jgi:hypothetical protein
MKPRLFSLQNSRWDNECEVKRATESRVQIATNTRSPLHFDSILVNVDALPAFSTSQLPYQDEKGEDMFVVQETNLSTSKKREGDSNVNCPLCEITLKLHSLCNHVGIHLLRSARGIRDEILTVATQVCTHS